MSFKFLGVKPPDWKCANEDEFAEWTDARLEHFRGALLEAQQLTETYDSGWPEFCEKYPEIGEKLEPKDLNLPSRSFANVLSKMLRVSAGKE